MPESTQRAEPVVGNVEGSPAEARAFLLGLAAAVVCALLLLGALSVWSNHFGDFGPVGQLHTYNDRLAKSEYLAGMPVETFPEAWILGSSNTMPFLPAAVEERFGLRTFNLGVFWGRVEDSQAWISFLREDLGTKPDLLIFGVETWSFAQDDSGPPLFRQVRRRLLNAPRLAAHLEGYSPLKRSLSKALDIVSAQNLRLMAQATLYHRGTRAAQPDLEDSAFRRDGSHSNYARPARGSFLPEEVNDLYSDIAGGRLDTSSFEARTRRRELVAQGLIAARIVMNYVPGDHLSAASMATFRRIIARCQREEIPVAILILPVHPYFYDLLVDRTNHLAHLDTLRGFLADLDGAYPTIRAVVDASHIERFGGSARGFHDPLHMTPDNAERALDRLREAWEET